MVNIFILCTNFNIKIATRLSQENDGYETLRKRSFNGHLPSEFPSNIVCSITTGGVVVTVRVASRAEQKISVRSGGHSFPACSLIHDGVLIDATVLNSSIDYDHSTKALTLGPGCLSEELATACQKFNRLFPF